MKETFYTKGFRSQRFRPLREVRGVEEQTHKHTADGAGDGDGHDPGSNEQADTLPVDSLVGTVAEADTDGSAGDAHGGRDGEGELREDEDGDGGTHLHAAAAGRRVIGDLVAHDCENIVSECMGGGCDMVGSLPFMML